METTNSIIIAAGYDLVFGLAARVEQWASFLPHYRYVKLLRRQGNRKLVRMSAWRDFLPVTWTAIETVEEGSSAAPGRIKFKHIRGLVRGMDVEWSFRPAPGGHEVAVSIAHHLPNPPFPVRLLGPRLIDAVVGRGFIGYIAGKTLARVKQVAEAGEGAPRPAASEEYVIQTASRSV